MKIVFLKWYEPKSFRKGSIFPNLMQLHKIMQWSKVYGRQYIIIGYGTTYYFILISK